MTPSDLRGVSYNCRGLKSALPFIESIIDQFDLCFLQEHWLIQEQLSFLEFHNDFCSVGTSGMNSAELISGRPYGGCGILFRKSLLPVITRINSCSTRFCALSINSNSIVTLFICVYFPTNYGTTQANNLFLETICELRGFIDSYTSDNVVIVGDFNVDFQRVSFFRTQLQSLMSELNLNAVDLQSHIGFTYERDDGKVRSWPDHVLTFSHLSSNISHVKCLHSASNLSDHVPLCFNYHLTSSPHSAMDYTPTNLPSSHSEQINWDRVTLNQVNCFQQTVRESLPCLSPDLLDCCLVSCEAHHLAIDDYCSQLFSSITSAAVDCFPIRTKRAKIVPGWNDHVRSLRDAASFWNSVWTELDCPSSGTVFDIRKRTKAKFKYAVRRVKRRRDSTMRDKIGASLSDKTSKIFWKEVKRVKNSAKSTRRNCPIVDGYSRDGEISSNFRTKLCEVLNSRSTDRLDSPVRDVNADITSIDIEHVSVSRSVVEECLKGLGKDKYDGSSLSSNHIILASPVLINFLSDFFTIILRHGYMPKLLRDCVVLPIPKPFKDPSKSDNYRPIALASNLSKVFERCILCIYHTHLITTDLQFGFKSGTSTGLCTGVLKNVVSSYLQCGTNVYSCFLDASKAFDRVDHQLLFQSLLERQLPKVVLRFLFNWYQEQSLSVKWNSTLSASFGVSNGVRQGGVLSPILFTVYIDNLLNRLSHLNVGCHSGPYFAGSLCYADDIALISPSPSSLRILLSECEKFAKEYGIVFNAAKTQLICFRTDGKLPTSDYSFTFFGTSLRFSESVVHLGHLLHCSLDDSDDVLRVTKDMCRKANHLLQTFAPCGPLVKTKLVLTHCLSLYGAVLWKLSCKQIKSLEIAFNNILRRIWKLPRHCHTRILHLTAGTESLFNKIVIMFTKFVSKSLISDSLMIRHTFSVSSRSVFTPIGYNFKYINMFIKNYSEDDVICAEFVRDLRLNNLDVDSTTREDMIYTISTS